MVVLKTMVEGVWKGCGSHLLYGRARDHGGRGVEGVWKGCGRGVDRTCCMVVLETIVDDTSREVSEVSGLMNCRIEGSVSLDMEQMDKA